MDILSISPVYSALKGEKYKKTLEDDLEDMGRGLYNLKGKVSVVFGDELNADIQKFDNEANRNENMQKLMPVNDFEKQINMKRGYLSEIMFG